MATKTSPSRRAKADSPGNETPENSAEQSRDGASPEAPTNDRNDRKSPTAPADLHNISDLKDKSISELTHIAKEMGIEGRAV